MVWIHPEIIHYFSKVPIRKLTIKSFHKSNSFFSRQVFVSYLLKSIINGPAESDFYKGCIVIEVIDLVVDTVVFAICSLCSEWSCLKAGVLNR